MCDAQLLKLLSSTDSPGAREVLGAIGEEQEKRVKRAAESLGRVLGMGDVGRMEGEVVRLAREGKVDEPFLLLLAANESAAKEAGARGPAEVLGRLRERAGREKDRLVSCFGAPHPLGKSGT